MSGPPYRNPTLVEQLHLHGRDTAFIRDLLMQTAANRLEKLEAIIRQIGPDRLKAYEEEAKALSPQFSVWIGMEIEGEARGYELSGYHSREDGQRWVGTEPEAQKLASQLQSTGPRDVVYIVVPEMNQRGWGSL